MKKTKYSAAVFGACYLSYCAIYVARLNLTMASPELLDMGYFSLAEIGLLGGIFSAVYAAGRLLSGLIGDRLKPWIVISLGLVVSGISNILFGFFPPFWASAVLWCANAFSQSLLWGAILRLVSASFSTEVAGRRASQMATAVTMGNILSVIGNSYFISYFGVEYAFIIPGGLTLFCVLLVVITAKKVKCAEVQDNQLFRTIDMIKKKEIRSAIYPAFLHGIIKDNISLWMTSFFVFQFGINLQKSAYFVLFVPVVGFIGRILYPIFYRLLREQENSVSIIAFVGCAVSLVALLVSHSPTLSMVCLGVIYAAVSIVNTSFLSITPLRYAGENHIASVSGILDFATYLGASLGSFVYGYVIDLWGYTPMFASWLIISLTSIVLLRKHNKSIESQDKNLLPHTLHKD